MTNPTIALPSAQTKVIGQPLDRVDGRLKVTGQATYAYEHSEGGKPAFGYILGAAIGKGRIAAIDTSMAERLPGVLYVMTHKNAPVQAPFELPDGSTITERVRPRPVLTGDLIRYYDEPIAFVMAETFEQARAAANLIKVRYARDDGQFDLKSGIAKAYKPKKINAGHETDSIIGEFDAAFNASPVTVDEVYITGYQSHNPMEPHAALAMWAGDELTVYTSTQSISWIRGGIANTLQMPKEKVRVISHYIGGGFGNKLIVKPETILAALGARAVQRPVKVAFTRQQMFANAGHRPMMIQKVRLAADNDGRLNAIAHEVISQTSQYEEFAEQTAVFTRSLYAAPNRVTTHRLVKLDMHRGEWMRAPGEAPGMLALESAMDELAQRLSIDPIELRIRNEPTEDPERKAPFSQRNLIGCMREGARRFGWNKRKPKPASIRDGRTLIGMGMSAAIRPNLMQVANAAVRMDAVGRVTVWLDMTDIGTGSYTILTQVAAETLGVPLAAVTVMLGDSRFPESPGSGGSWGAGSCSTAVLNACLALKQKIADAGGIGAGLEAAGKATPGEEYKTFSQHTYGAHFAEVGVDMDTGEIRLKRMLGVFAAGRIFNPKMARSQIIGGMIWGVSSALMEEAVLDPRFGQFVNRDLAEYHVPVNADIPDLDAVFLDERDDKANPFGAKGIGELGICGAGASIINAVYNATGVRVREFPVTLDKLLPFLPREV